MNCPAQDSLSLKGQLSAWILYNGGNDLPLYVGGRYIPQLNYDLALKKDNHIDFEASLNINGSAGFNPFDSLSTDGQLKPYRLWARYSSQQFEVRIGSAENKFRICHHSATAHVVRPG